MITNELKSKLPKMLENIYNIISPHLTATTKVVFNQIKVVTDPIKFDISVVWQKPNKAHLFEYNEKPINRRVST
jgi:hypothetical protein